jgi:hypothetical protein
MAGPTLLPTWTYFMTFVTTSNEKFDDWQDVSMYFDKVLFL